MQTNSFRSDAPANQTSQHHHTTRQGLSRRQFLALSGAFGGAWLLAGCNGAMLAPAALNVMQNLGTTSAQAQLIPAMPVVEEALPAEESTVLVKDVLDYNLTAQDWPGDFGSVTFRLHEVWHNGSPVYHIRTDASEAKFAAEEGLVHVPLLAFGAFVDQINQHYSFSDQRPPVIAMIPGDPNYSSLFHLSMVHVFDSSLELTSVAAIEQAAAEKKVVVQSRKVFVNYPLIQWPGGGMGVDPELKGVLSGGQLFAPPDLDNMTVTMKLFGCFPGSRYIITDTSAAPMAPMMNVPASVPMQQLKEVGGVDEVWVFANGIPGPGVMGFQPAIFDSAAGDITWSPFWDHYTLMWQDESQARVIRSGNQVRELVNRGELVQFNGVPDSHPNGFVVNCPVPILAENRFGL